MHEQAITLFIMNKRTLELTHLLSEKTRRPRGHSRVEEAPCVFPLFAPSKSAKAHG